MILNTYLARLEDTLRSRKDITIHTWRIRRITNIAIFKAIIQFYDDSQLDMAEQIEKVSYREVKRVSYKFHYQQADKTLIFRYDDSPHYPKLSTFPHHKHVGDKVYETQAPDLTEVLREIDTYIYPKDSI